MAKRKFQRASPKAFSTTIGDFCRESAEKLVAVHHEAAQVVADEVRRPKSEGGNLPVLKGNLRRSLIASLEAMPAVQWRTKEFPNNDAQIKSVIASAQLGDTIYLGFQAPYAQKAEYAQGNGFVRLTAQRWQFTVQNAVSVVKERAGG
jgi:hypothetical protein